MNFIETLRQLLGDVAFGSLLGATIGAVISILVTVSNGVWQAYRDSQRWQREKLYELHVEAQQSLTNLVRSTVLNNGNGDSLADFYAALSALDRLKLVAHRSDVEVIESVVGELKEIQKTGGALMPYRRRDEVAVLGERITQLAQQDKRLNELFRR